MADRQRQVPQNVSGEFFVDTTCIDCDTCRQIAPDCFGDTGQYSYVQRQPEGEQQVRQATWALLSCPTGSIGTVHPNQAAQVMRDFPLPVADSVFYCGFNSAKSYGGNSYFIQHPDGNWLVDSPRYVPVLRQRFEAMGGIRYIFLTHRDDVADAARYARHFGSTRIIHEAEWDAQPDAEWIVRGSEPIEPVPGFRVIPTPGHTKGHCVLLVEQRFLFSGDHLWWRPDQQALGASRRHCWYSWGQQQDSMRRLLQERFEWVLPGHGQRHRLPADQMQQALNRLLAEMARA